jgi:flagellar M-ring protein FliF
MKLDLASLRSRAGGLFAGFSRGQQTMLALAGVGVIAVMMLFTRMNSSQEYTVLYGGLPAEEAAKVTEELTSAGVPYRLSGGGTTIEVPRTQLYQLRLDMSAKGLPAAGNTGYSLLDKQGITTSEFRQRVDYQRALEGELSQTIGAIDGVTSSKVHLVIPKDDLFSDDTRRASASVLIGTSAAQRLSAGQVQAIVHLVSSSIEGLSPDAVTVADASGRVLAAPGQNADSGGDARSEQKRAFEDGLARSIEDMLTRVTGGGRAVVKVNADLDFDAKSKVTESFESPENATTLSEKVSKETYAGGGAGAVGVLGPTGVPTAGATNPADPNAAQTPTAQATAGAAGAAGAANGSGAGNSYTKDDADRQFAVGKVTEKVDSAPGAIKRLSVAVLLDRASRPDQARLTTLVEAAAGINRDRGDVVEVGVLPFDTSAQKQADAAAAATVKAQQAARTSGLIRTGIVALVVLASLFILWRGARKSAAGVRTPIDIEPLLELEPLSDAELAASAANSLPAAPALDQAELERRARLEKVTTMVDDTPEDVAKTLRAWMADRRAS